MATQANHKSFGGSNRMMNLEDLDNNNLIMSLDNDNVLDRDYMKVYKLTEFSLTDTEKEVATQLIRDGYLGTFDELILTVKRLSNE